MDDRAHGTKPEAKDNILLREDTISRDDRRNFPDVKAKPRARLRLVFLLGIAVLLGFGLYRILTAFRAPKDKDFGAEQQTAPQPVEGELKCAWSGTTHIFILIVGFHFESSF